MALMIGWTRHEPRSSFKLGSLMSRVEHDRISTWYYSRTETLLLLLELASYILSVVGLSICFAM